MLPLGVTIPVTVPQRSEIPEGPINYPQYLKIKQSQYRPAQTLRAQDNRLTKFCVLLTASRYTSVMKTNLIEYSFSVYFVNQTLHVSAIFLTYHQEVYCIYTTNWYVLCFSVDCLLAGRSTESQSTEKHKT